MFHGLFEGLGFARRGVEAAEGSAVFMEFAVGRVLEDTGNNGDWGVDRVLEI